MAASLALNTRANLLPAGFLALGTFAIGTEGFMIAPLLPVMARDFAMPVPRVALLVVVFTLVLALSSPVATVATGRMARKRVLLLAMSLFAIGNAAAALSSSSVIKGSSTSDSGVRPRISSSIARHSAAKAPSRSCGRTLLTPSSASAVCPHASASLHAERTVAPIMATP